MQVSREWESPVIRYGDGGYPCEQFYGKGQTLNSNRSNIPVGSSPIINAFQCTPEITGFDVPDNKTTNNNSTGSSPQNQLPRHKLIFQMNDKYHREDERLKTFETWPLSWMDKHQLALTGMFYTGDEDKVKCYFCEVEIGRWEHEDVPVHEHMRWSPNCPLLRRRTTNNVPINIDTLNAILPPASYDTCGNDIEVRPMAYSEGTMVNTNRSVGGSCITPGYLTASYFPEYPEYAVEAARIRSYAEWPRNMKQKPEQLAEAGFFYTGGGDRVKCFSCGGGLKDWNDTDEPWEQHALWLSKCRFLKLMKGTVYIDSVVAKQKAQEAEEAEAQELAEKSAESLNEVSAVTKPMQAVACAATQSTAATAACSSSNFTSDDATAPTAATTAVVPQSSAQRICDQIAKATETETAHTAAVVNSEKKQQSACSSNSIPEEKLCKICYAGEYNTAFLPCGHVVACAKCASSVTKCPLCRKPFTDVMRVYFS